MIEIRDEELRQAMRAMARSFKADKVNRTLKREVSKKLRAILQPMVDERRARVLALPSKGKGSGQSMRQAIARKTVGATRWSGKNTGVSIIQRARGMPRDFQYAGRAFNRKSGWKPTSLAGEVRVQQIQPTEWFDAATLHDAAVARRQVISALNETADSMANEIRQIR